MIAKLPLVTRIYRWYRKHNFRRLSEAELLLEWLDARLGEKILDIGCGDGLYDFEIAKTGAVVTGIDIDEKKIRKAARWNPHPEIDYHFMDAKKLAFERDSFDKVASFCVIEHIEDDDKVLAEIERVLKPGGSLYFSADSLSLPEISDEERQVHASRYAVKTFYDAQNVTEKLVHTGFAIEKMRFILSSKTSLRLMRTSWWLDRLPSMCYPLKVAGDILLGTLGNSFSQRADRRVPNREAGVTLLVQAKKA